MDFQPTFEQKLLRDTAAAIFASGGGGPELARAGLLGLLLGEGQGGAGLGLVEAVLVAIEAGRALARFPVAQTMAALPALVGAGSDILAPARAGTARLGVSPGRLCLDGARLHGTLAAVAADADVLVAEAGGGRVAVLHKGAGVVFEDDAPLDLGPPTRTARVDATGGFMLAADDGFRARLTVLRTAEMFGAAERSFELAVQYLKDRTQFGRPIGANQALKHMAADDFVAVESMRVALDYCATAHDCGPSEEAARALKVLVAYGAVATRRVVENAIQIHGGIGATWECALNGYLRRVLLIGAEIGGGSAERLALADALAAHGPAAGRSLINQAAE